MTLRTRDPLQVRRIISALVFAVSLLAVALAWSNSHRGVVRIGALLFALGSIATYVAAGTRRNPVRDVDLDGRDL